MTISFGGLLLIGGIILLVSRCGPKLLARLQDGSWSRGSSGIAAGIAIIVGAFLFGMFAVRQHVEISTSHVQPSSPGYAEQISYTPNLPMTTERTFGFPVWRKIILLAIVVVFLAVPFGFGISRLLRSNAGMHAAMLPKVGLALLAIPFAGFLFYATFERPSTVPVKQTASSESEPDYYRTLKTEPRKQKTGKVAKAEETRAAEKSDESKEPLTAESTTPEIPLAPPEKLPDWVSEPPQRKGGVHYEVVSKVDSDARSRYEWMDVKLVERANRYIDEVILHEPGASSRFNLQADYLREKCNGGEFESQRAGESYFRLKFDKDFRTMVEQGYRAFVSDDRLRELSTVALLGFVALGGLYVFLRATPPAKAKPPQTEPAVSGSAAAKS